MHTISDVIDALGTILAERGNIIVVTDGLQSISAAEIIKVRQISATDYEEVTFDPEEWNTKADLKDKIRNAEYYLANWDAEMATLSPAERRDLGDETFIKLKAYQHLSELQRDLLALEAQDALVLS